jgi:hypothetical protein
MNPQYDFISNQQEQLISLSQRTHDLRNIQVQRYGAWGKVIGRFGDVLINCGSWMKRVSSTPIEKNSVGVYTQN